MIADMLAGFLVPLRMKQPRNMSPENPAFDLQGLGAYLRGSGSTSKAGATVTHDSAMGVGAVFQAVSMISGDVAGLTLSVYKKDADGNHIIDRDHPAQPIVSIQWNRETSAYEGTRRLVAQACLWGNSYAYIEWQYEAVTGKLKVAGLYNLLPDRTKPMRTTDGTLYYRTFVNGEAVNLRAEEVFHLKSVSIECNVGIDLVDKARECIGLSLAAEQFTSEFFSSGCKVSGLLELPLGMAEPAQDNLIEGFTKRALNKSFGIAILRDNAKFQKLTASAEESQTHELNEDQVRNLARFFNLPPSKLGIKDSVSYNSQEQSDLGYLKSCLTHWLRAVCSEGSMKLLTYEERHGAHWLEHNLSNFIEPDTETMTNVLVKQVEARIISPNMAAKKLNLPTHEGGDTFENPNTSSPNKAAAKPETTAPTTPTAATATPTALLDVPNVPQLYDYDCGAAATAAVCKYFAVGPENYADYIAGLGTTPEDGTDPNAIIDFLHEQGLAVTSGDGLTLADLRKFFAAGQPVIVPLQMYGTTPEYDAEEAANLEGHYVVVVGTAMGLVMFMDPSADNTGAESGGLGVMREEDFDERWHDMEADGVVDDHFGMAVSMRPVVEDTAPDEPAEPPKPEEPKPEPKPEPAASIPLEALRPLLSENLSRMGRRVANDVRRNATKDKLPGLVDAKLLEHRAPFDEALRATAAVIGVIKGESADVILATMHGLFFAGLLIDLAAILEPPHKTSELAANVEIACKAFETTIAEAICVKIL